MKSVNTLIEELGNEKVHDLYSEYMNKKVNKKDWHPYIITPSDEYYEDDTKQGYVLDVYASDIIGEYDTFDEAFTYFKKYVDEKDLRGALNEVAVAYRSNFERLIHNSDFTAYRLSERASVPETTLNRYMKGESNVLNMTLQNAHKISNALEMSIDEFYVFMISTD